MFKAKLLWIAGPGRVRQSVVVSVLGQDIPIGQNEKGECDGMIQQQQDVIHAAAGSMGAAKCLATLKIRFFCRPFTAIPA